jgi:hypothetical protein
MSWHQIPHQRRTFSCPAADNVSRLIDTGDQDMKGTGVFSLGCVAAKLLRKIPKIIGKREADTVQALKFHGMSWSI